MRIYSGLNPSSSKGIHIGNYFGAVKRFIDFQNKAECFYSIANIHSLNSVFNPEILAKSTENVFIEYLALGINPEIATFFVESDVEQVAFLQTILNNAVTVGELKRMHGYKDKLAKMVSQDSISAGLFEYPVLMASDILLFDADTVPVGEDQSQHVEICREIARTFNNRYGEVLIIPNLNIQKDTGRIIGIDGARKMSKSLGNDLPIFGSEEEIKKQIMSIKTDPTRIHPTDPGDPKKNVTFSYFELLQYNSEKLNEMKEKYIEGKIGDVEIKFTFYEFFLEYFADCRSKKRVLQKNLDHISEIRKQGKLKASEVAQKVLDRVKNAVGIA